VYFGPRHAMNTRPRATWCRGRSRNEFWASLASCQIWCTWAPRYGTALICPAR